MSVVIPDDSGAKDGGGGSKPDLGGVLTAVGLVLTASFFVGVLSSQPVEEPSATLADEEIATSLPPRVEPLDWQADPVGATWPRPLVEFEGSLYFFGSSSLPSIVGVGRGLEAWVLVDGAAWKSLGTVIQPPNEIQVVSAIPRGLVAVGSADGHNLDLWSSLDARVWTHESALPADPSNSSYFRSWAQAVGGTGFVTVVFGSSYPDIGALVRDALPAEIPTDDESSPVNIGWGGPPWAVNVYGPLGLTVFSATYDELGLPEDEVAALLGGVGYNNTTVWTSVDGQAWTSAEMAIGFASNVFEDHGDLIANGYGPGNETWISSDGVDWEPVAGGEGLESVTPWRDGLVATSRQEPIPDIVYSADRFTWEPTGLRQYLPAGYSWWSGTLAAGGGGLAAVLSGYGEAIPVEEQAPRPVVINKGGYTLEFNETDGTVILKRAGAVLLHLATYSNRVYNEVVVDFRARSLTFLNPDSLEPLVTFTFDEIEQAEADALDGQQLVTERQLLAFSADGSAWSVADVADTFGDNALVQFVHVTDNQVIAVVTESWNRFSRVPEVPNVVIWSAPIP